MEKTPHYKDFLERGFQARLRRNPGYSLRAYARDLGMQPSKLSEVLRGRCGLSAASAARIALRLRLAPQEAEAFVALVESRHGRSKLSRRQAQAKLDALRASAGYDELSLERFKIIADWHHFAILEIMELAHYESSAAWIAGRLGIATPVAAEAIERLLDFGLLKRADDGKLSQTHLHLATPSGIPSRELREHHLQILSRAEDALEAADVTERDYSATTLAIDSTELEEMRKQLKEFRRKFARDFQVSPKKDRVYCLGLQFFPLDLKNKENDQ